MGRINKKGAIVIVETFISIFLILSFFVAYMNYTNKNDYVYDSEYEVARSIFEDENLRECFDALDFGCYTEMNDCLSGVEDYYSGDLIVCIMNEDFLPQLPKVEVSSFRMYKTIKNNEINPYEIGLYLILN